MKLCIGLVGKLPGSVAGEVMYWFGWSVAW